MLFVVVRRTWGPDTVPGDRRARPSPLQVETVAQTDRQEEADRFAKAHCLPVPRERLQSTAWLLVGPGQQFPLHVQN